MKEGVPISSEAVPVVNPCATCQPLGAIFALKGIANTVALLHGSQGCATYMRRHMSGHFNEPIDVASSSLSEKGAVYGGEANLVKALHNVIESYSPAMVGVVTTCLSETIGDDVERIARDFACGDGGKTVVVPISTPAYGGRLSEGFGAALRSLVEHLAAQPTGGHGSRINVIPGNVSPADVRYLVDLLDRMRVGATVLPDVSETLDAPMGAEFRPIPEGGTAIDDIRAMSSAAATIECGLAGETALSAAAYLHDRFGVACWSLPLPIGLGNTDTLLAALCEVTGQDVPERYVRERGRLVDAMVDAHKVFFGVRAVIYGEPDLAEALTGFALEVGMEPAVIAGSGAGEGFERRINVLLDEFGAESLILADPDFDEIESTAREEDAEVLIGNSEGRRIAETLDVPLVRIGFPIHDRLGAQRQLIIGYEGAMNLIELVANPLLEAEHATYRSRARRLLEVHT